MKIISLLNVLLILGLSAGSVSAQEQEKKKIEKVTFKTSIDCEACVNTIMSSVPLEKGIRNVVCDLDTREVMVEYRTKKTDRKKVQRMIEKLGYTAEEVNEEKEKEKEK
ncbi:MAG: heavy-metal-associated domain-containing protein [Bacteroidales bacterium]|nr:heavy-metal-associated domain-containing protein [Bacteroidales bacterium]